MSEAVVPETMAAMQLMAHGGVDQLQYRTDVATPRPGPGEVLVRVSATAKNNTDRKAREGLYPTRDKGEVTSFAMGGEPTLTFPRIQGGDVAGRVVTSRRTTTVTAPMAVLPGTLWCRHCSSTGWTIRSSRTPNSLLWACAHTRRPCIC
ncbi:alcohol dehydrogenase catalytic domain-containing protein [Halomonadaceae bacterium KBTZ08]